MIKVIFKEPGEIAKPILVKDFNDMKHHIIPDLFPEDSMVQAVPIFGNYWLLCDEEARLKTNPPAPNINVDFVVGNIILGNIIICRENDGDFTNVKDVHINKIIDWLKEVNI